MTIPLSAVADGFGVSNEDIQYSSDPSQNWWSMNDPLFSDQGVIGTGILNLNGNTNWINQGKIYGGVELGGMPGDNINSSNCKTHTATQTTGNGFAGWFKPSSLDGQLFSRTNERIDSYGGFDGFNVSITEDGWLQTKMYWAAQNESDTEFDYTFNLTKGMNTPIQLDEWNYITVSYYRHSWNMYVQVYVDNGTSSDASSAQSQSFSPAIPSTSSMLTWGGSECIFGDGFDGTMDELRMFGNTNPFTGDRAMSGWKTAGPSPLPTGLSFDYDTGDLTGTPLTPWEPTDYNVTVMSGDSSVYTTLTLEVVEPELPSITHGSSNNFYLTTGDEETISPPANIGGSDAFWTLTSGHPNYTGEVDVSPSTTCALDDEGKLYCWGKNENSRVLDASFGNNYLVTNPTLHPDAAAANLTFTKIAAEANGLCGILTNGSLWCWGDDNGLGYLGLGYDVNLQSPEQVLFDPELNPYANTGMTLGTYNSQGCNDINPAPGYGFESFENTSAVAWEEHLVDASGNPTGSDGNWSYTNTSVHSYLNTMHGNYVLGSASSNQVASYNSQAAHTIVHNEDSIVTMNITTGTGLLSFCYMWSTYYSYDYMYVYLDGVQIHVETTYYNTNYWDDWRSLNRYVTAGDHTLTIKFRHDTSNYNGFDRVFIDALKWPLPTPPVNWTEPTVTDFAWHSDSACAVADSDVYCWGENGYGQLGNGDTTDRLRPTKVSTPTGLSFTAVDVGTQHACALADDASMWCWGYNAYYQLGNANNTQSTTPVEVDFGAYNVSVSSIEVGQLNTCAIGTDDDTSNEQLWCWGYNVGQQTQVGNSNPQFASNGLVYDSPSTGSIPIHVETDTYETCTLFSNSTVQCMGKKFLTDGSLSPAEFGEWEMDEFSHVTSLSSGGSSAHGMCVMVQNNKALFCWGNNVKHNLARGYVSAYGAPDAVYGLIAGRDDAVLAPGLTFNNSNGVISGTPIVEDTTPVELNIYACNGRGCDSDMFNYSIWDRPEVGLINIESDYLDLSVSPAEIYKGRPVNLSITVTSDRTIVDYTWYSEHINGLTYSDMFANSPSIITDQLPVGLQVIFFSATDDIGGTSTSSDGWVIVEVLESDDDNDQVPVWNDLCPLENALGYDDYTGNGSSIPTSDGCIDNSDDDPFFDPDDDCPNQYAAEEYDLYTGEDTNVPGPDGCIDDTDRDTILENVDSCLTTPFAERFYVNPDGCGPSERDSDGDGYKDNVDACQGTPVGESVDEFGCGESQVDSDGDGVYDNEDVCPESPLGATVDVDGCSAAEKDSDGDEINDEVDVCDTTPPELWNQTNAVGCAPGDLVTDDFDEDGIADIFDNCPQTPLGDVVDYGGCGLTQKDTDNDGITDDMDQCPETPGYDIPTIDSEGCGSTQRDSDSDGVIDSVDQCLNTPTSVEVDSLGCQAGLSDADLDSIVDIIDACPDTTGDQPVNLNGCAAYQLDSDGDGITNDLDSCPTTPAGQPITTNGCAEDPDVYDPVAEDDDGDGILNENDECPQTPFDAKVIDNRGCEVKTGGDSQQVSVVAFGLTGFILLVLVLITLIFLRRKNQQDSIWSDDTISDVLFDIIDSDGDGVISDEEWEIYKQARDSKQESNLEDDDDLFN
jgi:alpha-tubulin suppressor-like RCC1 family protein